VFFTSPVPECAPVKSPTTLGSGLHVGASPEAFARSRQPWSSRARASDTLLRAVFSKSCARPASVLRSGRASSEARLHCQRVLTAIAALAMSVPSRALQLDVAAGGEVHVHAD